VIGFQLRQLLRALAGGDEAKRWEAAQALVKEHDPEVVRKVERLLQSDRDDAARAAAAWVLGFSEDTEAATVLARTLADREESPSVRAYAAEGLGHLLQHEPVLAEMRAAILGGLRDPEPEVRFWSAFAAAVLGLQETRPYLVHLADNDGAEIDGWWSVAEEAEWALRVLDGEEDPPLPERLA
jgi:HEAT repeat protein